MSHAAVQPYIEQALALGAADALAVTPHDLCFDSRTLLKCMFGCDDWGRNHSCPSRPANVSLAEYKEMLCRYSHGVLVHTHDKASLQRITLAVEGRAFAEGYYFAFSLADCGCCAACAGVDGQPCRFPQKARPALHSVGIDVFATVRRLGLPIHTLTDPAAEEQNWYGLVFIE